MIYLKKYEEKEAYYELNLNEYFDYVVSNKEELFVLLKNDYFNIGDDVHLLFRDCLNKLMRFKLIEFTAMAYYDETGRKIPIFNNQPIIKSKLRDVSISYTHPEKVGGVWFEILYSDEKNLNVTNFSWLCDKSIPVKVFDDKLRNPYNDFIYKLKREKRAKRFGL